ncbi:MAG TPA: hypothetical protein VGH28_21125 [Polyangiaceae bacterium]
MPCIGALVLVAGCAATAPAPKNAATSSALTTGQPRATDDDISTTRTTSAEIRAEQPPPKPVPEPRDKKGGPESLPDPNPLP